MATDNTKTTNRMDDKNAKREAKRAEREAKKAKEAEKKAARKLKRAEKRAERKAKREAKRVAMLEKKRAKAEAKKQKREAKKARELAKREKDKAKKIAIREKKRLAREKKRAAEAAKKLKFKTTKKNAKAQVNDVHAIDIREAAKNMKLALAQIASEMVQCDLDKRLKMAKSIHGMGYDVKTTDGNVIVRFDAEKSKKDKVAAKTLVAEKKPLVKAVVEQPKENEEDKPEVEMVPAGDLYGQDGNASGEIANLDDDPDMIEDNDDEIDDNNDYVADSRDEQDNDIVDNRRDFFGAFGDDGEMNDD